MIGRLPTRNGKSGLLRSDLVDALALPETPEAPLGGWLGAWTKKGALVKWAMIRGTGEDEFALFDRSCSSCATWTSDSLPGLCRAPPLDGNHFLELENHISQ